MAGQRLAVLVEIARPERLTRPHEPMAFGEVGGDDAIDVERNDVAVENAEDPLQRPHPSEAPEPRGHRLRPWEAADDLADQLGQDVGRGAAGAGERREEHAVAL